MWPQPMPFTAGQASPRTWNTICLSGLLPEVGAAFGASASDSCPQHSDEPGRQYSDESDSSVVAEVASAG
jgi:hypothetical protein